MSSPRLSAAEVLDHIVDFLHDSKKVPKSRCLVSKSWVPRSRRHIFASVAFRTPVDLDSWKETFQDSSTSPAFYTKTLHVGCPDVVTAEDAEEGGWVRTVCRVVWFEVEVSETDSGEWAVSFFPFHGFSPAVTSLVVTSTVLSASDTLNLVYSFPLLEDLTVNTYDESDGDDSPDEKPAIIQPLNPPAFTGSLNIFIDGEMEPIVSPLLSLPGTLCFREIKLHWKDERDVSMTAMLAEKCCATLESLSISCSLSDELSGSFDLSKATKLESIEVTYRRNLQWVATVLRAITRDHKNFRQILIDTPHILHDQRYEHPVLVVLTQARNTRLLGLDRLFVHLSESHSIRPRIRYLVPSVMDRESAIGQMGSLLPEATTRGLVDLTGYEPGRWRFDD